MHATTANSAMSVVDSEAASPETIQLTNGRTIHADSITDAGAKSLVKSLAHAPGATPLAAASTAWEPSKPATATVTGTILHKLPIAFGDDPKNWYLLESTGQLREECRTGEFATRFHPEMKTIPSFPNSDDAQRICAIMSGKADDEYERLVDRGVELEPTLCYTPGYVPKVGSNDRKIAAKEEELSHISADFGKRMLEFQQNPHTARTPGLRLMLDMYRLSDTCGHRAGF